MWWTRKPKGKELLKRYLDPSQSWSPELQEDLRTWRQSSDETRATYDKRIVAHRIMVGLDPETPSGIERERTMGATISQVLEAEKPEKSFFSIQQLVPLGVAALVLAIATPALLSNDEGQFNRPISEPMTPGFHGSSEYISARGGQDTRTQASFGVAGVRKDDNTRVYEIVKGNGFLEDKIRFEYRCTQEDLKYLFVFGLQNDSDPIWYYPSPVMGEKESVAISCSSEGKIAQLEGDTPLVSNHVAGDLKLFGVFTDKPLAHTDVEKALQSIENANGKSDIQTIQAKLGLNDTAILQRITVPLQSGSKDGE